MKISGRLIRFRPGTWIILPALLIAWLSPYSARAESDALPFAPAKNGCGPYQAFSVTGSSGGIIWGSNPYTDDSSFSAAAVHAGLISIGETAVIEPYLVDNYPSYGGSTANGISTYDWGGSWCGYYIRVLGTSGETPSTTTTLTPFINPVTDLMATANENGSIFLSWSAPTSSNIDTYAYGVKFYDLDEIDGTPSGGWEVWTNQGTTYLLDESIFSGNSPITTGYGPVRFSVRAGSESCFSSYGQGPCIYGPEVTVDAIVVDPTPPTTTTIEPETTTTEVIIEPEIPTTTELIQEPEITTTIPLPATGTTSSTVDETTTTMEKVPETISIIEEENVGQGDSTEPSVQEALPEPEQLPENETQTQETAPELPVENDNTEEISTQSMSADDIYESATSMLDEPLTDEQFNTVLETIFDEPLSDEQFEAAITAVLDSELTDEQFSEVVSILNGDSVTEEQVSSAVTSIIENGITEDQATELATSAKVLESISADVAAEIFQEINVESLTEEQSAEIVAAIQNAPTEIKESFEEEINVFDGAFDAYVPVDSTVSVGERRTIVAVTVVSSVIAISAAAAPPAPGAPSGGSSSGGESPSGGDNGGNKPRRRRGGIK